MDRSENAIRGMVAKCGGKRGFAMRCLALYDPVNELQLAALYKVYMRVRESSGSDGPISKVVCLH